MEEEGDLKILVFSTMEYERESSRTEYIVMPNLLKVEEGVYIVWGRNYPFFEISACISVISHLT